MQVREAALAGTWYPGDPVGLRRQVDGYLAGATGVRDPAPLALIAPHAGLAYSGPVAGQGYGLLAGAMVRRVILLGFSHRRHFPGAVLPAVAAYATPLGQVPLVPECEAAAIRDAAGLGDDPGADTQDNSLEIHLPFLQRVLPEGWRLVPIVLGHVDGEALPRLGRALRPWFDRETLVIASSDFTHYGASFGYEPFPGDGALFDRLRQLDGGAVERILARDPAGLSQYRDETGITLCGHQPIVTLLHMLPADARGQDVAYSTSGAMTGDWRHSVSYQTVAFRPGYPELALSAAMEERLLGEARAEVTRAAAGDPTPIEPRGGEPVADVFVTLRERGGRLRGCIGSLGSPRPLVEATRQAARGATVRDVRFQPVTPAEVPGLHLEISVLTPVTPIRMEEVEIGRHGLALSLQGQRGVFLPKVAAEQGWDLPAYLQALCRKALLPEDAYLDPAARLESFEALCFAEGPA